jgi:CheY-like chemotaxis protein
VDEPTLHEQLYAARRQAAVGRLAGGLAHDFNNLLTAVLGYSEMLLGDMEDDHPWRADVQEVFASGQRAARLTKQLLAFNRHVETLPQLMSWARLIDEIRPLLASLCGEVRLEISVQDDAAGVEVLLDRGDASHMLFTLAWLARIAGGHSGVCRLTVGGPHARGTGAPTSWQHLSFSLPPAPSPDESEAAAFDEAFRDLHRVVARAGGELVVSHEGAGAWSGAIGFPVEGGAVPESAPSAVVPVAGLRVLVAEDEEALRQVVRRMLELSGHMVTDAASGEAALAALERSDQGIDLLVSDVMMPGMSGVELAEKVAARLPQVRVLYISGYADAMSLVRRTGTPAAAFLAKPFTRFQLQAAVTALFEGPRR